MKNDNERRYPIVLQFLLIACLAFDIYLLFYSSVEYKLYCIAMLLILIISITNSIGSLNSTYNDIFCILDILEFFCFGIMLFSILDSSSWTFWLVSAIVQIMYVPWNGVLIKTGNLSPHTKRKVELYSKLDLVSAGISLVVFIISIITDISSWFLAFGFISWVIILTLWGIDNFTLGSKLELPGNKIVFFDVETGDWQHVKSISVDAEGRISKLKIGSKVVNPDENVEYYLLPGLIDTHVHIDQNPYGISQFALASNYDIALNNTQEALESGITTLCDMGGYQLNNYYIINKMKNTDVNTPNLLTTGCFISKQFGHYMSHGGLVINDDADAKVYANYLAKLGIKYVKLMLGNLEVDKESLVHMILTKQFPSQQIEQICKKFFSEFKYDEETDKENISKCLTEINTIKTFSYEELKEVVHAFTEQGLTIFAHAYLEDDVKLAIEAGITRIEHPGHFSDELIDLIKQKNVIITSTFVSAEDGAVLSFNPENISSGCTSNILEQWFADICVSLPKLYEKGCKVALGTDAGLEGTPCCSLPREIISLVEDLHIPIQKVLKSATIIAAEKLNLREGEHKIGDITIGANADFVIYEKNFIDNPITLLKPMQVWVKGRKVYDKH